MVKYVPVPIDQPDKRTLTSVESIDCRVVSGEWTVKTKLIGSIFTNETVELVCKIDTGRRVQWWNCGNMRGHIEDRILSAYHKYRIGPAISIEWFKREP